MREFYVFKRLAETPGKNDKIALLKNNDTPNLRRLLHLTYNKFQTYRVQKIEQPATYNTVQPDITDHLEDLLLELAKHKTGSNDAKQQIKRLLSVCTKEGAEWVTRIIQRDLNVGIDEKSINKAFPGLIPVFSVQLAEPLKDFEKLTYPVIVEEKLDGVRVVAVVHNETVKFFSREGREFTGLKPIADEILKLRPGTDYILDGEIIATEFNPENKTAVKNKDGNWPFAQALSMLKTEGTTDYEVEKYLGYFVWDVLPLDVFEEQKKSKPLTARKLELAALFARNNITYDNLHMVPNTLAYSQQDVMKLFRELRDAGKEGAMIKDPNKPYEFKRSVAVYKLKEMFTCDLRIIDAYEGNPDTKYSGTLGGVVMASDCGAIKADCGSGFDDDTRMDMWLRHLKGKLAGTIVEISYQEKTADGSLRFPVFDRERNDKTTTSVE